jgi:hypothetical protein
MYRKSLKIECVIRQCCTYKIHLALLYFVSLTSMSKEIKIYKKNKNKYTMECSKLVGAQNTKFGFGALFKTGFICRKFHCEYEI